MCIRDCCINKIDVDDMPTIVGVGDTITSNKVISGNKWLRGGSDRGFLTLIQKIGAVYRKQNKVIFVDSSDGEVDRPSTQGDNLRGITDEDDYLKLNLVLSGGHKQYIEFIKDVASIRIRNKACL